jgi:hypothetical protein
MRNYWHFQTAHLSKANPDAVFTLDSSALDAIRNWGITDICFPDHDPKDHSDNLTLFTLSAISFGSNEQRYDLQASLQKAGSEIRLRFVAAQAERPIATFTSAAGSREWRPVEPTVISQLGGKFRGRHYKEGELDIFALVETIGDKQELPVLQQQRSVKGSTSSTLLKVAAAIAVVALVAAVALALSSKAQPASPVPK